MKQSKKAFHPKLNEHIAYHKFITNTVEEDAIKLIAHCLEDDKKKLSDYINIEPKKYLILIGPEGDFTEEEIKLATDKKFEALDLGEARLRTETAAIKACALVAFINEN